MSLLSRKPREVGKLPDDFRPPSIKQSVDEMTERLKSPIFDPDFIKPESEVMPIETGLSRHDRSTESTTPFDTRPPHIEGADRLNPLDDIALRMRRLTYGEMIDLATEIWNCRGDGLENPPGGQGLPETLHRWAVTHERNKH